MFHDALKEMYTFFFKHGDYDESMIANFVGLGLINVQDYKDITGEDYVAPTGK